jgi:hypothetical protein
MRSHRTTPGNRRQRPARAQNTDGSDSNVTSIAGMEAPPMRRRIVPDCVGRSNGAGDLSLKLTHTGASSRPSKPCPNSGDVGVPPADDRAEPHEHLATMLAEMDGRLEMLQQELESLAPSLAPRSAEQPGADADPPSLCAARINEQIVPDEPHSAQADAPQPERPTRGPRTRMPAPRPARRPIGRHGHPARAVATILRPGCAHARRGS